MIKTLLATGLILIGRFAPHISLDHKPKQDAYNSNQVLKGAYTFNDEFDYNYFESKHKDIDDVNLNINSTTAEMDVKVFMYGQAWQMYGLSHLYLDYDDDDYTYRINFYETGYYNVNTNWFDSETENVNELASLTPATSNVNNYRTFIENFVIVFYSEYYIDENEYDIFNLFFSSNGNRYTQYYNGFYHYNNGNFVQSSYNFTYESPVFMVQNQLTNNLYHDGTNKVVRYFYYNYYENAQLGDVYAYNNNENQNIGNMHIQGLLPKYVRQCYDAEGIFEYITPQDDSTWYQMIMACIDAPLKYLSSMFNFELFGLSMFVALCSLMTILIVMQIIKKVI